jgi:hypothetical protein
MRVECTCLRCGKAFSIWPSRAAMGWGKFCSHACRVGYSRPSLGIAQDDGTVLIPLTQGKFAIIDYADRELVLPYKWHLKNGYAARRRKVADGHGPCVILMHRVLCPVHEGMEVDHRNRDRLDNRRENLRPATSAQNKANGAVISHNTSGYRGVGRTTSGRPWTARIGIGGRVKHLGNFSSREDAALAYDKEARTVFGEFAFQNFPEHRDS